MAFIMKGSKNRRDADAPYAEFQSFQMFQSFQAFEDYFDSKMFLITI